MMKNSYIFLGLILLFASCKQEDNTLPILGRHEYIETDTGIDTIYHEIADFAFLNQDSAWVTNETFKDKVYVADFFFTSCPSICPIMKVQLLRVYEKFKANDKVMILSHSIDPDYDNVAVLRDYAKRLEVSSDKWNFITGDKAEIYDMAQTSYYVATRENENAPGGYEHSGAFILVDNNRHIRGVYDGTDPEAVSRLLNEIDILIEELGE
jgi:protein SCO1/2